MLDIIQQITGPSPALITIKVIKQLRAGEDPQDILGLSQNFQIEQNILQEDEELFEKLFRDENLFEKEKLPRLTAEEFQQHQNELLRQKNLLETDKLLRSVLQKADLTDIEENKLIKLRKFYFFQRKYKNYLRIKRCIPLGLVGPVTGTELTKMGYASAIGLKSVEFTLLGFIGLSLPAFFLFHMASFYAPDKIKPICNICKFSLAAPLWIVSSLTDELTSKMEEKFFGEEVPIDLTETAGTIPASLGDLEKVLSTVQDIK